MEYRIKAERMVKVYGISKEFLSESFTDHICVKKGVTSDQAHSKCRKREYVDVRALVMHFQYFNIRMSYPEIAKYWGYKCHSSVRYLVRKIEDLNNGI